MMCSCYYVQQLQTMYRTAKAIRKRGHGPYMQGAHNLGVRIAIVLDGEEEEEKRKRSRKMRRERRTRREKEVRRIWKNKKIN